MRSRSQCSSVVAAAALVASVLLSACGRLGYAQTSGDAGVADAQLDASVDAGPPRDGGPCPGAPTEPCTSLVRLPLPPVIDGVVECGLALSPLSPIEWTSGEPIPSDHRAELAVAWHEEGVYFFVHVIDPTVRPPEMRADSYCGDGVEVYVDADGVFDAPPDYDMPGTRQLIVPAPEGASSTRAVGYVMGGEAEWTAGRAIAVRTGDGYVVETFVRHEDVFLPPGMLEPGARVGIDLSINVAGETDGPGPCGRRLGQYFLHALGPTAPPRDSCGGLPFCNVEAFCTPVLSP